jgi:O-antigen/teichoic acid export membrane protein
MLCLLSREAVRFIAFANLSVVSALALDLAVCALQLLPLVALGWTHRLTVGSAYATMAVACALPTVSWLLLRRSEFRWSPAEFWPHWRRNWVLAKWALVATSAGVVYPLVSPWVLEAWHKEAVGVFVACVSLAGLPQMIIMGVNNWAGPQAARAYALGGLKSMSKVLAAMLAASMVLIGGFAIATVLAGNWIMIKVWGEGFAGSGPVLAVLALAMVAHSISNMAASGLWAMELPRAHAAADWSMLLATVLAAIFLVGPLGALGAAWASFAGAVVSATVRAGSLWLHMERAKPAASGDGR